MSLLCCVIPFHNGSSTIARALDSVFAGTVCGEVVVVCDGSSESLRPYLGVAHLAQERAGRLRVVEMRTNLGQGGARNIGVALSLSPLVCFLDQDDECLPGFHESCVEFLLDKPDVGAVEVDEHGEPVGHELLLVELPLDGELLLDPLEDEPLLLPLDELEQQSQQQQPA
jgi:GT2 family glycosyltransferase